MDIEKLLLRNAHSLSSSTNEKAMIPVRARLDILGIPYNQLDPALSLVRQYPALVRSTIEKGALGRDPTVATALLVESQELSGEILKMAYQFDMTYRSRAPHVPKDPERERRLDDMNAYFHQLNGEVLENIELLELSLHLAKVENPKEPSDHVWIPKTPANQQEFDELIESIDTLRQYVIGNNGIHPAERAEILGALMGLRAMCLEGGVWSGMCEYAGDVVEAILKEALIDSMKPHVSKFYGALGAILAGGGTFAGLTTWLS